MNRPAAIARSTREVPVTGGISEQAASPAMIFALLFAAALGPVLCFGIPPAMVDYPNHLARMFVEARAGTAQAQPFYEVHWALIPNLAMDILVPRLGRIIGVETATRLFYLASQLLIVSGALAIERAVKGRMEIAGFVALMFLYSVPFAWGFVNFEFGLGAALWGIAGALMLQERASPVRLAAHAAIVALLFAAHMFALGVYGFTVVVHELWRAWSRRASAAETFGRLLLPAMPALALLAAMHGTGGGIGGTDTRWYLGYKPAWLLQIMSGYSFVASAVGVIALLALIVALYRRDALRFAQSGAWLAAAFAALYVVMPSKLFDTSFVDLRVIVAAALILPAFVAVSFPNRAWMTGAIALTTAVTLVNVSVVAKVWISYRADYAAAEASFLDLPKGAKILIGHSGAGGDPPMSDLTGYPIYSVPILAVNYADAFVPNLFTQAGKQPVSARAPWQRLDIPYGGPVPVALLEDIAAHGPEADTPQFIRSWPQDFDYLYLVGPKIANPMPRRLEKVSAGPRFVLYRIKKVP